ncbi:YesL family protein [Gracilibacillus salinarum]|uniref:DUF624 domain-containing protein n=1 Tax=Gracilibacillus salinarum TaxID=2932255 RepID=A0ABY4GS51_9BACI|nr:DUF624 domain-containing protein [Gracilibacillus salinarum]UOQ86973.1 DUF624 domain-containing protein [Gracilibacillus salinarum]
MNIQFGMTKLIQAIAEWVTRLALTNMMWLLFNVPVILFSVNLAFAETRQEMISIIGILFILAPFITFPATGALFAVVRRWTMEDTTIAVFKSYIRYWKQHYKQSIIAGLIIEVFWMIYAIDYYYFTTQISSSLALVFIMLGIVFLMITLFFICSLVHDELSMMNLMKNAIIMVITNPIVTVSIGVFNLSILYISFRYAPYLIVFFLGSLIAFVTFSVFYKIHKKVELIKKDSI